MNDGVIWKQLDLWSKANKRKDFKECDRIRGYLSSEGIVLQYTPTGVTWKKRDFVPTRLSVGDLSAAAHTTKYVRREE